MNASGFFHCLTSFRPPRPQPGGHRPYARRAECDRLISRGVSGACSEALEGRCLMSFAPAVNYPVAPTGTVVTADFNGDGLLDLATRNAGGVSVLLGNGDGTLRPGGDSANGTHPGSLAVGDFNADGTLDLATAEQTGVSVLPGRGDGTFGAAINTNVDIGGGVASVAVGDFNADGTLDLGVTANTYSGTYYFPYNYYSTANVLLGNGDGTFAPPIANFLESAIFTSGVVADFNGDDHLDFAAVQPYAWYVSVLLGDGRGNLHVSNWFGTGGNPLALAAGDVNGDLKPDLVTANEFGNSVTVALGDGAGRFGPVRDYAAGSGARSVLLGDFTGDGHADIATVNNLGNNVSVLRGRGDGSFSTPQNFGVGPSPWAGAAGDFNSDGWLDAVTTNYDGWESTISVLINDRSWPDTPLPTVSVSDATVTEGNAGTANATFTLTLSSPSAVDVKVHYATGDINAVAGSDYAAASGDVIIPAGQTSRTFSIAVTGDRLAEQTETFAVNLSAPTNATVSDGRGTGTIVDNEPRISINDVSYAERHRGASGFTFTVRLSAPYDQAVTVNYATANGTATAGSDYQSKAGTVTFAPGETTKTITVAVFGDRQSEPDEAFFVYLGGASSNAMIQGARGMGLIFDDDSSLKQLRLRSRPTI